MVAYIVWPLAVMVAVQRVWWSLADPTPGRFLALYDASFRFLNPHTAFASGESALSPGAIILTAPWAVLDPDQARWVQLSLSVLTLLGAWVLLLRLLQIPMWSVLAPVFLLVGFHCGPVTDTLLTGDLGAFVVLALVTWLYLTVKGHQVAAGVALGAVVALMPIFAALLVVPLLQRRWRESVLAAVIACAATALVWARLGGGDGLGISALGGTAAAADRSFFALAEYLHIPTVGTVAIAVVIAVVAIAAVALAYSRQRGNEVLFLITAGGALVLACCLLAPVGHGNYSIALLPLVGSVVLAGSAVRVWPAWLAIYAFGSEQNWYSTHFGGFGEHIEVLRVPAGWLLLLATICAVLTAAAPRTRAGAAEGADSK
ncbi:arabinofuranan 3-O-arabinosyltransferase [Rhodococcus sp. SMB37]|nr:arabinofuranan 3-O-arabinosyltransferase [Rhodococcus sp. SMB37]